MKKYLIIFFLLISCTSFSQVNLTQGLVAYYPFTGNANDVSGNLNNPVFNNATLTTDRFGNANKAYSFNGVNNYIQIPNSASLNPSPAISLCAWVKVKDFYTGPCRGNSVLMKGNTEGSPAYKIRLDENSYPGNLSCGPSVDLTHEYFYGQGLGGNQSTGYDWVQKDQWYSVVYTYDGTTAKLYIDCELQMSVVVPGISMTNGDDLFIGSTNLPSYPYWFNGVIDEVRIYDRAINPTEVKAYGGCCTIVNSETHNPAPVCAPATIDLTNTAVTTGSDPRLSFSYFADINTTIPVPNPSDVNTTGIYYIKGTAFNICTTVDPVTVTIWDRPAVPGVTIVQPSCSIATGSISIANPDPANTFNYSIDQASYTNTTGIFSGLIPKNYLVTIKNAKGCISQATAVTIDPQPVTPPTPAVAVVNNCDGTSTLSTSATGILLWSNNEITSSIIVNTAGSFTVTQTANGCTSSPGSGTAAPKNLPPAPVVTVVNNCGGTSTLSTSASGTLLWNNNSTTSSITVNTAGNYTVVQTINGCTSLPGSGVAAPMPGLLATTAAPDIPCGQSSGTITVNATNGSAPYSFSIDAGTSYQPSNIFSNLAAGNYTIKIKDAGGCTLDIPVTIKQLNSTITATANAPDIACGQTTGIISVNASNGTAPYSFSIDAGNSYQSSNIFSNLAAGNYSIKIKDAGGCTLDIPATIKQLNSTITATSSAPDISCGQTTGTITVNANNGTAPYFYSIDAGSSYQSSNIFSNLAAGNYSIKIKDAGGCTLDIPATIKQLNSTISATASAPDIACGQTTGTITVNANNGTAPYFFSIDAGNSYQSSNIFSNLAAGNYTIKIKDAGGCTLDIPATIKQLNSTITATASAPDIACGQTTGAITVNASNGTAPYSFSIDAGTSYQASNIFSNLSAGNYTIKIKDGGGCTLDVSGTIKQLNSTITSTASAPDIACGQTTGTITVNASNGTAPYSFSIDAGDSYQSSNIFSNLAAGNYTIKIKDGGGCTLDVSGTIKQLNSTISATASAPDIACGQTTGTITVNASNGTAPFSFSIDAGNSYQSSNIFSNLAAGNYTIKIKDAGGCSYDVSATIKQLNSTITATANAPDIACGQTTGAITVNASNGSAPYSFSIDAGNSYQSSNIFSNLAAGNYTIKIKDGGGCTLDASATIKQLNSTLTATANIADISCSQPTGSVITNVSNGISPYSYSINAGVNWQSSNAFLNLTTGNYIIWIKDAAGCDLQIPVSVKKIGSPITAVLKSTDVTCLQPSGTIAVSAANGTAPYGYSINGGTTYQASNIFNNLLATNYTVRVRDALGCLLDTAVAVKQNNLLPDIKITNPTRICEPGTVDLTAPLIITGSETGLTYTYFKEASLSIPVDQPTSVKTSGTYFIKGVKANGCYAAKAVSIVIPPKSTFAISPDASVCNNQPVQLTASGGTSYLWQPSNVNIQNPVVKPAATTVYTVKIKDSVCNDSSVLSTTVRVLSAPDIKASKSNDIDCTNDFVQLSATGGVKYVWQPSTSLNNPNIANPIARPGAKTVFTVTGYTLNGCSNTDTITVNVDMNAINKSGYSLPNAFTPNNDGLNDCFGLKYWGAVTKLNFSVYNRFGQRIFYTTDPSKACWDGRYKGIMQGVGTYVYVIQATTLCDVIDRKGTVMILK